MCGESAYGADCPKHGRSEVARRLRRELAPKAAAEAERKIGVLAIAIDVLDKACPPQERSG